MKKLILKAMAVMIICCVIVAGYTIASSALVEVIDEKLVYGTDIAEKKDYNIVNGVTESYIVTMDDDGSNRVANYVLEIDMSNSEIGILTSYKDYMNGLGKASWGMQALRDQAVEVEDYYRNTVGNEDFEVVAGVNGDFFNMGNGAPTGTLIMNGIKYNENKNWPFFAILDDGTCVIGERGDPLPENAMQVLGGPEVLIKDGVFTDAVNVSGYGVEAHPRTAIGIKENGDIVMLVSDGRQAPESCGQTFHMLAEAMLALGCVDSLCLDGGGSASFISQRDGEDVLTLRNSPSDGIERTVSTGLLIYTNKDTNKYTNVSKWFEKDGKIGYYGADGVLVTGEQTIDGFTYNFDKDGVLLSYAEVNVDGTLARNRWSGTKYYLGADGIPVKGEQVIGGKTFVFNSTTGVLEKSELKNKWCECGPSICYFDGNGNKVTGNKRIGVTTYPFDSDGKLTAVACVKDDGTLVKNQWFGKTYYLGDNGLPRTGKIKIDNYTYTFGNDGKFLKGDLRKEGYYSYYYIAGVKQRNWHYFDGKWHYFDRQTGYGMATGANSDKVSIDFDRTDGLYTVSTTDAMLLFKFDNNGGLIRGAWLETDYGKAYYWGNHERVTGWQTIEGSKYYFNNDTYAVTGKKMIDGVMYGFKSNGKLDHTYAVKETVNPTCTSAGHISYVCDCGDVYVENIDATGHNYTEVVTSSTCTVMGTKADVCKGCGDKKNVEYFEKIPHEFTQTVTPPTCAEQGFTTFTCTFCGEIKKDNYVDATGHKYDSVVTPPTIDEQGYTTYTCSVCGNSYKSDFTPALGHEYVATVTPPTCTEKGYTTYVCKNCENDSYIADYVDATGHDFDVVITEVTCTQDGCKTSTCKICGEIVVDDVVKATGHKYDSVVTPPTTDDKGYTTYTCTVCGDSYESDYTAALGHDYVATVTPPTCTEKGYTTYVCKNCEDDSYVADYVDATGHDYVQIVTDPTCTQTGYITFTCACGETYKGSEIAATGHTESDWIVVKPAEIGVAGTEQKKCSVCQTVLDEREIPALEEPAPDLMIGDVNEDGKITAADARLALRISAKLQTATDNQTITADYNKDSKITAADARLILRKSAKLEP